VWCFLIPSCYIYERKKITLFAILFLLSFSIGCFFIYFFIIPKIYHFFITFEIKTILVNLELTARIQPYIVLTSWLFIALLFFFLAPFLFLILYKYKIINSRNLLNNRKFFIFFSIFAGAFFSPPDFFGQLALAIFFFIFLELIIWLSLFFDHNKVHNLI
jgi:sec-independent protein translocase protein TatC